MKLNQRPLGVKFRPSEEHPLPFHMGVPISKCLAGSEGRSERVTEGSRPTTTTWKIVNIFQVRNEQIYSDFNVSHLSNKRGMTGFYSLRKTDKNFVEFIWFSYFG